MKKILLLHSLIFTAIAFLFFGGCKKEQADYSTCYSCNNDTIISTITDFDAMVVSFAHDPVIDNKPSTTLGFTISKRDIANNNYIFSDSLLVPCPAMPKSYQVIGKKVKISGYIKSCDRLLSCYNCSFFFGRKFDLTKIQ
ncbi:hypothetical protein ACFOW1_03725 [Parasediminibacterium paludis]|uniref:Lipoprotein n=1 Tax=Parasediminibacterium paludis TaxID=908966 RepID=A0ABV8PUR5_9BACT